MTGQNRFREAHHRLRQRYEGKAPLRPILTGTARHGWTQSDLEALECVASSGQNDDGTFPYLEGYDPEP